MLPAALLACCQLSNRIVDGFKREDGEVEHLLREDLGRCFSANEKLISTTITNALWAFRTEVSERCEQPRACQCSLLCVLSLVQEDPKYISSPDPFKCITYLFMMPSTRLCRRCLRMMTDRAEKKQKEAWNELPGVFGLQITDWEHLD